MVKCKDKTDALAIQLYECQVVCFIFVIMFGNLWFNQVSFIVIIKTMKGMFSIDMGLNKHKSMYAEQKLSLLRKYACLIVSCIYMLHLTLSFGLIAYWLVTYRIIGWRNENGKYLTGDFEKEMTLMYWKYPAFKDLKSWVDTIVTNR